MATRKHGPPSIGRTHMKAKNFVTAGCSSQSWLTTVKSEIRDRWGEVENREKDQNTLDYFANLKEGRNPYVLSYPLVATRGPEP
ncbi:uncharacterized protein G2W53_017927 [Senna tora]|uniref:Uncharacterized protein n=1 Tax=Senna tora TaxID=362788 RepID=A0A834TR19_9FABA|nr:uncharacterized protein G2W53_017927 [Senna tora]